MLQQMTVLGAKSFNDTVEGTKYDTTKLLMMLPQPHVDSENRKTKGYDCLDVVFGTSANFTKHNMQDIDFPIIAEIDLQPTTKGFEILSFKATHKAVIVK